jgi:hypothetical protein
LFQASPCQLVHNGPRPHPSVLPCPRHCATCRPCVAHTHRLWAAVGRLPPLNAASGPSLLPLSMWRHVRLATPPFLSPPVGKEPPKGSLFAIFSPRRRPEDSGPHRISPKHRRHPPLTVGAHHRPLLCILWHASPFPPSPLPTGATKDPWSSPEIVLPLGHHLPPPPSCSFDRLIAVLLPW